MLKRPTVSTSEAYPAPPLWVLMKSENFEKSGSVVMSDGALAKEQSEMDRIRSETHANYVEEQAELSK